MSAPRFYLPDLTTGTMTVDGQEAHHLLNVRRLKSGDMVEVFDGCGHFAMATISKTSRRDAILNVEPVQTDTADAQSTLTIAAPLPRPERARWMVEKLPELGVNAGSPLITERRNSTARSVKLDKLKQYVIDACKQSGRNTLMAISEPGSLGDLLEDPGEATLLVASQAGSRCPESSDPATLLIGPEGGFTNAEADAITAAGGIPVTLARHILRVETAAIAGAVHFAS